MSTIEPNQITGANAGERLGFAGKSRVVLCQWPGVAAFGGSASMRRKLMTKRFAISMSAILALYAFRALADPRVVVRDWSYETAAGRFGYWNVRDDGVSPPGTDRYFFFGPLGHFSVGRRGLIVRPKPMLGIISLSGISIAMMLWAAKWRRHGDLTADQNHWSERGRTKSGANAGGLGRPRRSAFGGITCLAMKNAQWIILAVLLAAPLALAVIFAREFLAVDAALDAGGSYDYREERADSTQSQR